MSNPAEALEEWLSKQVGALRKSLAKATLGAWTAAVPLILVWSGLSTANKIIGSILWVSVTLNLFLIALLCWHRVERRRLIANPSKSKFEEDSISDIEDSLLEMMYAHHPNRYTLDELHERSGLTRAELDLALLKMIKRTPPFIVRPSGGLWHHGQPNPKGFGVAMMGLSYIANKKNSFKFEARQLGVGDRPR